MPNPQETPAPPAGTGLRMRDVGWLFAYALRGFAELARARVIFARLKANEIPARNRAIFRLAAQGGTTADPAHLARMAYVLPRLSARLPWRSDCLVQAIAAQNWLAARRLAGEIQIGVERPADGPFGAHAWLVHEGMVITGGDIARYQRLLGESPLAPTQDEPDDPRITGRK
ncbi:MAG: lasso peptide biosynthesis B2 protein [Erythrobacter sp.]